MILVTNYCENLIDKPFASLRNISWFVCSFSRHYLNVKRNEMNVNPTFFTDRKEGIVYKKGGTEIGKNLAEKSKGLFSADDWQCKT